MSDRNQIQLNELYQGKKCEYCGAEYPKTCLNIEGHLHHGEPYRCLDTKACRRRQRRAKKRVS